MPQRLNGLVVLHVCVEESMSEAAVRLMDIAFELEDSGRRARFLLDCIFSLCAIRSY